MQAPHLIVICETVPELILIWGNGLGTNLRMVYRGGALVGRKWAEMKEWNSGNGHSMMATSWKLWEIM